ncbi:MAG: tRNA lysidine(34) synthetase TilS [Anaerolineae bacterium]|jgi:tRNA(Ile)-lysidine synthase|nr:tRNA lysidine(34) synthetase TilS [Anaerolineae bacterium]MBT7191418.1 tRNA lysidine(34) synthetase TilS [Anaerolineae bacterium]MBT7992022.1 tRNA lysidine(34) synthetase TilS [Anaerolineae bacterium]
MDTLSPSFPIIVGVSGGADSLCLLGTLHEAGYPLIVAHFDHQLRPESDEDAKFVESIAAQYALPFVSQSDDVAAYAKSEKQSIEEAARNLRYRFLFAQARKHKAQAVAVGHTADDQVETVLMHFLRGAGLSGLKGIQPRTILPVFDPKIPLIRPILELWRKDTVAYCAAHDLVPHEDPSNATDDFFRNRLRHNLIPELENYNPRFRETLQRTSQALNGDHALITELTHATWQETLIEENAHYTSFHLTSFGKLSTPLIRNLIRHAVGRLRPGAIDISFSTLEGAAKFIASPQSAQQIDLVSGLILFKEQDTLYLTGDSSNLPLDGFPQLRVIASEAKQSPMIQGEIATSQEHAPRNDKELPVYLPCKIEIGLGWVLTAQNISSMPMLKNADPFQVTLDADMLGENLILRPRRAGDKFQPLGMDGKSMKLKDFFINEKLPRRARDRYPLLCVDDEIIWIPGYRPAHRVRVTESTQRVVVFTLRKG